MIIIVPSAVNNAFSVLSGFVLLPQSHFTKYTFSHCRLSDNALSTKWSWQNCLVYKNKKSINWLLIKQVIYLWTVHMAMYKLWVWGPPHYGHNPAHHSTYTEEHLVYLWDTTCFDRTAAFEALGIRRNCFVSNLCKINYFIWYMPLSEQVRLVKYIITQSQGNNSLHLGTTRAQSRQPVEVQSEPQNRKESWFMWLWTCHSCWCHFRHCWCSELYLHRYFYGLQRTVWKSNNTQWVAAFWMKMSR